MSAPAELAPRARQVVGAARELLEAEGADAVTMRRVAERLGIRAPSLYKHVPNKEAIEMQLVAVGFEEAAEAFQAAVAASNSPLADFASAYCRFALAHPHLYRLMHDRPLQRDLLPTGAEDRAAAPLIAAAASIDRARAVWAFAHAVTILELNGRFPAGADLDKAWHDGIRAFTQPRGTGSAQQT